MNYQTPQWCFRKWRVWEADGESGNTELATNYLANELRAGLFAYANHDTAHRLCVTLRTVEKCHRSVSWFVRVCFRPALVELHIVPRCPCDGGWNRRPFGAHYNILVRISVVYEASICDATMFRLYIDNIVQKRCGILRKREPHWSQKWSRKWSLGICIVGVYEIRQKKNTLHLDYFRRYWSKEYGWVVGKIQCTKN